MDSQSNQNQKGITYLNGKGWYRFLKVLYIGLTHFSSKSRWGRRFRRFSQIIKRKNVGLTRFSTVGTGQDAPPTVGCVSPNIF